MKKYILLLILIVVPFSVLAKEATNISDSTIYYLNNSPVGELNDNSYNSYLTIGVGSNLTIKSLDTIKYVYIMYEMNSVTGTLSSSNEKKELGKDGYLHELVKLNNPNKEVKLKYNSNAIISEIRVYTDGDLPSDVQVWSRDTRTDLMLFSTHSDDEVLFFGGIIPTYINRGKKVHVVYLTRHEVAKKPNQIRLHEVLDGLWTSGVRDYPTFGILPDEGSRISKKNKKGLDKIIKKVKKQVKADGLTDKKIINYYVKVIRKYKPKVILGHDVYGEYGHGQHIYNTYILKKAVANARNKKYKLTGTKAYKVPKVYLHLYNMNNKTTIDLDVPLEKYNNRTAYQVTQEAFKKHVSQQQSKYPAWLNGANNEYTKARDIQTSSPMYWGLYYSSVGPDRNKNDLFEHI